MKVLCIDASETCLLEENRIYEAFEGLPHLNIPNYYIPEIFHPAPYYDKKRFIELSDIDELELHKQQCETALV